MNIFLNRRTIVPIAYVEEYVLKQSGYFSVVGKSESCQRGKSNVKICLLKISWNTFKIL